MSGPGASGAIVLTWETPGLETWQQRFASWGKVVDDLTPVWRQIADDLGIDASMNFLTQGAVFSYGFTGTRGSAWAPLKPSTIAERIRKGFGPVPILVRTGALEQSLIHQGTPGNITDITPLGMRFGTSIPYAKFHHWGTSKMERRVILGMTRDRRTAIVKAIGDYIRQKVRQG